MKKFLALIVLGAFTTLTFAAVTTTDDAKK